MSDHFAKEAIRLSSDGTLKMALDEMRQEALGDLVSVDADNKTMILRLQAKVIAIDEFRSSLRAMIIRQGQTSTEASPFA